MMLSVTSRMQEHQIGHVIRAAVASPSSMMRVPAALCRDRLAAVRTLTALSLPHPEQFPPSHQGLRHSPTKTFGKVVVPCRIERTRFRFEFDVFPVQKLRESQQAELVHGKHPIAGTFLAKVASFDPTLALLRMSPFTPARGALDDCIRR